MNDNPCGCSFNSEVFFLKITTEPIDKHTEIEIIRHKYYAYIKFSILFDGDSFEIAAGTTRTHGKTRQRYATVEKDQSNSLLAEITNTTVEAFRPVMKKIGIYQFVS